jgi:hypothetical protein
MSTSFLGAKTHPGGWLCNDDNSCIKEEALWRCIVNRAQFLLAILAFFQFLQFFNIFNFSISSIFQYLQFFNIFNFSISSIFQYLQFFNIFNFYNIFQYFQLFNFQISIRNTFGSGPTSSPISSARFLFSPSAGEQSNEDFCTFFRRITRVDCFLGRLFLAANFFFHFVKPNITNCIFYRLDLNAF